MQDNDRMRMLLYTFSIQFALALEFKVLERLSRPDPKDYASVVDYERSVEHHPVFALVVTMWTGLLVFFVFIRWEPAISKFLAEVGATVFRGIFFRGSSAENGKGRVPGLDPFAETKPPFEP